MHNPTKRRIRKERSTEDLLEEKERVIEVLKRSAEDLLDEKGRVIEELKRASASERANTSRRMRVWRDGF